MSVSVGEIARAMISIGWIILGALGAFLGSADCGVWTVKFLTSKAIDDNLRKPRMDDSKLGYEIRIAIAFFGPTAALALDP